MYQCTSCGQEHIQHVGKCTSCNEWNCVIPLEKTKTKGKTRAVNNDMTDLSSIEIEDNIRYTSRVGEIDRVLGGGFILGSSIVIGGEPGIGKSTLALQLAQLASDEFKLLYISGEESLKQIKIRASRIGVDSKNMVVSSNNNLGVIVEQVKMTKPKLLIIDSIHTMESDEVESIGGSINQVRFCSQALTLLARELNFTLILIAHITKEGVIAGPKVLEHVVDTILYFEKIDTGNLRILRTSKNRFGATDEIGIFNMSNKGLEEIKDPTSLFLSMQKESSPGSVVSSTHEGTRPMLVEIQSLVSKPIQSFGKRYSTGIDNNRATLIVAILEKYCDVKLSDKDIFINLTKGIKVKDTSNDLAVAVSIFSSFKNIPISNQYVFIGELGLNGEVKRIDNINKRLKEISRLGFKYSIIPSNSLKDLKLENKNLKIKEIGHISEIIEFFSS